MAGADKEAMAKQSVARKFAEDQAALAASRARQAEDELVELQGELTSALAETKALTSERREALSMLAEERDRTAKMEQDQRVLIGYTDAIASQAEMGSPVNRLLASGMVPPPGPMMSPPPMMNPAVM